MTRTGQDARRPYKSSLSEKDRCEEDERVFSDKYEKINEGDGTLTRLHSDGL